MRSLGILVVSGVLALGMSAGAQEAAKPAQPAQAPVTKEAGVPPFHSRLPKGGVEALPPTLNPAQFGDPRVRDAYALAAKIRGVLYQVPCYCGCDKEVGHQSLLDCFAGDHASICQTCMMEGVYAYQETAKGKTPGQIRAGIERGEWKTINLNNLLLAKVY